MNAIPAAELQAGQVLQQVLLTASALGLSASPTRVAVLVSLRSFG
jgi:hypothetical protein